MLSFSHKAPAVSFFISFLTDPSILCCLTLPFSFWSEHYLDRHGLITTVEDDVLATENGPVSSETLE